MHHAVQYLEVMVCSQRDKGLALPSQQLCSRQATGTCNVGLNPDK